MASAKCATVIFSSPDKSAIVRETFKIRLWARALSPKLSNADFKISVSCSPKLQNFSTIDGVICEFEYMPE